MSRIFACKLLYQLQSNYVSQQVRKRLRGKNNSRLIWSFDGFIRGWSVTVKVNERLSLHDNLLRERTKDKWQDATAPLRMWQQMSLSRHYCQISRTSRTKLPSEQKPFKRYSILVFFITGVHASYQKVWYYLLKMKLWCCQGDRLMRGLCRQGSIWMAQRLSVSSDSQMPIKDQRCRTHFYTYACDRLWVRAIPDSTQRRRWGMIRGYIYLLPFAYFGFSRIRPQGPKLLWRTLLHQ